jgi:uncharacterized membrane protein
MSKLSPAIFVSALVALCAIPVAAGIARLVWMAGGPATLPVDARYLVAPSPVVIHIAAASLYGLLGAFQFHPGVRRRWPAWHRGAGRALVALGLATALTGLWMTLFYPPLPHDGAFLFVTRLIVGVAMTAAIVLGFAAIRRRDVAAHRAWMIRAYALGMGAGTQAVTGVLLQPALGSFDGTERALHLAAGWLINVLLAEWIVRRNVLPRKSSAAAAVGV